jgi:hypothetical protein
MSYEGPGRYRHHKGGEYHAFGVGRHESTGAKYVIYVASEPNGEVPADPGLVLLRPLNNEDGPDAWNELASEYSQPGVERFVRVDDEAADA